MLDLHNMKIYKEKKFSIKNLKGISQKSIEEHLKLYAGYVKNTNLILQKIDELYSDFDKNSYTIGELQRRFSFEFDGMRNHELYFSSIEGGSSILDSDSPLRKSIKEEWNDFDKWLEIFKQIALTRGIGWATLYYDSETDRLINSWQDEQHLGHLTGLSPILMLDMWEHSYVSDYQPSGKKNYVQDFFENLNWKTVEKNFLKASGKNK